MDHAEHVIEDWTAILRDQQVEAPRATFLHGRHELRITIRDDGIRCDARKNSYGLRHTRDWCP
jgi:hypothetical protein